MSQSALKNMSFTDQQALMDHITTRLSDLRESLEAPFIEHRLADYYRGRIAELKELKDSITE